MNRIKTTRHNCFPLNTIFVSIFFVSLLLGCQETTKENIESLKVSEEETINQTSQENNNTRYSEFSKQLQVSYRVVNNAVGENCNPELGDGNCFLAEFKLDLPKPIDLTDWEIYFSFMSPIQSVLNPEFEIEHVNGDLHVLKATEKFSGWGSENKQSIIIPFKATFWHLSQFDLPPNFYVRAENGKAWIIESTKAQIDPETGLETLPFVEKFESKKKQFNRTQQDLTAWIDTTKRFEINQAINLSGKSNDNQYRVIPQVTSKKIIESAELVDLNQLVYLSKNDFSFQQDDPVLLRLREFGVNIVNRDKSLNDDHIMLSIEKSEPLKAQDDVDESYELTIQKNKISIKAPHKSGAFYALQTLASLVKIDNLILPSMQIIDSPRFPFRGFHLDVARHFRDKAFVIKLLDQMAAYKLNKLHLHLADDEGWRLEIPGLPELTQVGSRRCHDLQEEQCLLAQLGSGPFSDNEGAAQFYSRDDYQYILKQAKIRHIEVIPSLDMPGHSRAAVKSMLARFKVYRDQGKLEQAKEYLLSDMQDESQYLSVQFYQDNTLNVCQESTYRFVEKVIDEVVLLHEQVNVPLQTYHIGADETAGAWGKSPVCQNFIQENNLVIDDLTSYFIKRIAKILDKKSIQVAGWSDGLSPIAESELPANIQANAWTPLFWDGHKVAHSMANKNWDVVISIPDATYFDFPYEANPNERGYYWASRATDTRQVFELMPENLPVHAEIWNDRQGLPMVLDDREQLDEQGKVIYVPMQKGKNFKGLQGHLWSEMVRSDAIAEYMIFPRIVALAERAWHKAKWEPDYNHSGALYSRKNQVFDNQARKLRENDWHSFVFSLANKELAKLEKTNVQYRIPPPGAVIIAQELAINHVFPEMPLEYQVNQQPWQTYTVPVQLDWSEVKSLQVRARSLDKKRVSRSVSVKLPNPE